MYFFVSRERDLDIFYFLLIISVLLILASQRIEDIMGWDLPSDTTKRGSLPSVVEYCILAYVAGRTTRDMKIFRAISVNGTSTLISLNY